tara:strand:+ start:43 stop:171 length:129 start_codon:yes stop_codon:yes gene_type:complete
MVIAALLGATSAVKISQEYPVHLDSRRIELADKQTRDLETGI